MKTPETYLSLIAIDTIFTYEDPVTGELLYDLENSSDPNQILDTLENALTDTFTSRQELYWWGEDSDGEIIGYQYRWEDIDTVWSFTTKEYGIFYVPILTHFDVFHFSVAAIDNDSLVDSTPAELVLPIKNSRPEIRFRDRSNPLSEGLPNPNIHYTFPTRTFAWHLDDLDGIETIDSIFYSLDDTCATCWTALDAAQYSSITLDSIPVGERVFFLKVRDKASAYSDIIFFPNPDSTNYPGAWVVKEPVGEILVVDDYSQDIGNNALNWYQSILDNVEGVGIGGYSTWEIGDKLPASKDVTATLSYFDKIIWYGGYTGGFTYNFAAESITAFLEKGGHFFLNFTSIGSDSTFLWFPIDNVVPLNTGGDIKIGKVLIPEPEVDNADTLVIASTISVNVEGFESSVDGFQSLYHLEEPDNSGDDLWVGTPTVCGKYQNQSYLFPNSGIAVIMSIPLFKSKTSTLDFKWEIQNQEINPGFSGMIFVDIQTGWIVGDDGIISRSVDGGNTWLEQNTSTTEDLLSVDFIDEYQGWAVGKRGVILNTSNGGENWELQASPTTEKLYSIDFINEINGWISGYRGTILHTNDAGDNWSLQTSGTTKRLEDIFFLNSLLGWCVGYSGTILHTENSGETWVPQEGGFDNRLHAITFINELEGWIVGKDGIILKTRDGGNSWFELDSGIETTLYDVSFLDRDLGWAVGEGGVIISTYDGGDKWDAEYSGVFDELKSIHIFDAENGKIFGSSNVVILNRTVGGGSVNFFNFLLNNIFQ